MKRDMDLIRNLLLKVEGAEPQDLSDWTEAQQTYHMALLVEANLVHGEVHLDAGGDVRGVIYTRLTWEGHEFLDAARDVSVWKLAKDRIRTVGSNVAWPVLTAILADIVKRKVGL